MTSFNPDSTTYLLIQLENYGLSPLLLSAVDFKNYEKLKNLSADFKSYLDYVISKPNTLAHNIWSFKSNDWRWNKSPKISDANGEILDIMKNIVISNNISTLSKIFDLSSDYCKGDVITYQNNNLKLGIVKGTEEFNILVLNVDGKNMAPPLPIYFGIITNTPVNYWNSYHDIIHFQLNIPIIFNKIVWNHEEFNNNHYLIGNVIFSKKEIKIVFPLSSEDWEILNLMMKEDSVQEETYYELIKEEYEDLLDLDEIGIESLVKEKRFIDENINKITTRFALSKNLDNVDVFSNKDELYDSYPQDQLTIFIPNDFVVTLDTDTEVEEFDQD
jgi:hypothetical protein